MNFPSLSLSTLVLTAVSALAQSPSVEDRLQLLEAKVAALEALVKKQSGTTQTEPTDSSDASAVFFQDGFEKGLQNWEINTQRIIMPYAEKMNQREKEYWLKKSQITQCDPWRSTKKVALRHLCMTDFRKNGSDIPLQGNRF